MRIGLFICECGGNISGAVDVDALCSRFREVAGVELVEKHSLYCSGGGLDALKESIAGNEIDRFVVAACSPKDHENTFMNAARDSGLNPFLMQLVDIREQCVWVTEDPAEATARAERLISAGLRRVRYHSPLEERTIPTNPDVLIVGGGVAGMEAALLLASEQRRVYIVEREDRLGGRLRELHRILPGMEEASTVVDDMVGRVEENPNIEALTSHRVSQILGFLGNFVASASDEEKTGEERELEIGAVVLATGLGLLDPGTIPEAGYPARHEGVFTAQDLERMSLQGKIELKDGSAPERIGIVHCVGRDESGYCSGVCCAYSMKIARYLREALPDAEITAFYRDITIPVKSQWSLYEQLKKDARVSFVRCEKTEVSEKGLAATMDGEAKEFDLDMVVLSPALVPSEGTAELAEMLNVPLSETGFFQEEHSRIEPVNTSMEGIYICGCAHGPTGIAQTLDQARAVAGKVLSRLVPGKELDVEARTSNVSGSLCMGCRTCLEVCTYGAIVFDETKFISVVNEVLCRGCGNCVASCPSNAISLRHFTDSQIHQEIVEGTGWSATSG